MEMCQYFSPNAFRDVFNLSPYREPFFTSTTTEQNPSNRLSICSFLNVSKNLDSTKIIDPLNFTLIGRRIQIIELNAASPREALPAAEAPAGAREPPERPLLTASRSAFASVEVNRCAFFSAGFVFNSNTFLKLEMCGASVTTSFYYSFPPKCSQYATQL